MAYSAQYSASDAAPAAIDVVVGVFAAIGAFATLIGLGVALAVVGKHFPFLKNMLK